MSSVTFSSTIGGDNSTVTDDADATTGLKRGGHRTRFVPALAQIVAIAGWLVTWVGTQIAAINAAVAAAAASAVTAVNAPGTSATSTTNSVALGLGSKTITVQTAKNFVAGMNVICAETATPSNQMGGPIQSYNSGTGQLVIDSQYVAGAGTPAAWTVSLSAPVDASLTARTAALEADDAKQRRRRLFMNKDFV